MTTTTDKMNMILPVVSETLGPTWAALILTAFEVLDEHDHTTDNGVKITPAAMNINAALDIANNQLQNIASGGLYNKTSADTTHTGSLQRVGSNLYWVNSSGTAVQLTSGSSVNAPGSGAMSVDSPGAYPYTVTTGDDNVVLLIDTTSARTVNLPAATNNIRVVLKDQNGSAQTNNITISPNGSDTIDGSNSDYTFETNFGAIQLISDGTSAWYVF